MGAVRVCFYGFVLSLILVSSNLAYAEVGGNPNSGVSEDTLGKHYFCINDTAESSGRSMHLWHVQDFSLPRVGLNYLVDARSGFYVDYIGADHKQELSGKMHLVNLLEVDGIQRLFYKGYLTLVSCASSEDLSCPKVLRTVVVQKSLSTHDVLSVRDIQVDVLEDNEKLFCGEI